MTDTNLFCTTSLHKNYLNQETLVILELFCWYDFLRWKRVKAGMKAGNNYISHVKLWRDF